MDDFTMAELGVFIGVLGGVVTSLILTFQKSKCETIECCCIKCKRLTPSGSVTDPLASASDIHQMTAMAATMGETVSSQSHQLSLLEEAVNGLQQAGPAPPVPAPPLDQTLPRPTGA
jgi:glyoxylate carboligase